MRSSTISQRERERDRERKRERDRERERQRKGEKTRGRAALLKPTALMSCREAKNSQRFAGLLPEIRDQNLVLTVIYVPYTHAGGGR